MTALIYALLHSVPILYGALVGSRNIWKWSSIVMGLIALIVGSEKYALFDIIIVALASFVGHLILNREESRAFSLAASGSERNDVSEEISKDKMSDLDRLMFMFGYFDGLVEGAYFRLVKAISVVKEKNGGKSECQIAINEMWSNRLANDKCLSAYMSAICAFGSHLNIGEENVKNIIDQFILKIGVENHGIDKIRQSARDWSIMMRHSESSLLGAMLAKRIIEVEDAGTSSEFLRNVEFKLVSECFNISA